MSDFSLEWQDVRHYSERSSYAKWFLIDKYPVRYVPSDIPDYAKMLTYEAVDDNPHQPRLNFENAEVQDMFSNVFRYWTVQKTCLMLSFRIRTHAKLLMRSPRAT